MVVAESLGLVVVVPFVTELAADESMDSLLGGNVRAGRAGGSAVPLAFSDAFFSGAVATVDAGGKLGFGAEAMAAADEFASLDEVAGVEAIGDDVVPDSAR